MRRSQLVSLGCLGLLTSLGLFAQSHAEARREDASKTAASSPRSSPKRALPDAAQRPSKDAARSGKASRRKQANAPSSIAYARRLLSRRAYRTLLAKTATRLTRRPFSPSLHAARMVGCAYYGDHWCVLESDAFTATSPALEHMREEALADALHHTGNPRAAAQHRRMALTEAARPVRTEWHYTALFLDLEEAGDWTEACDVAWEAVAWNPSSATPWALVARCAAATGSLDEAESYLWLAAQSDRGSIALSTARIDIHRTIGDAHHAASLSRRPTSTQQRSARHSIARHRALLAIEEPDLVIESYDARVWSLDDEIWHPGLLATYAAAFAQAGHPDLASELSDRLAATYPDNASAQSDAQTIRALLAQSTRRQKSSGQTPR